MIAALYVARGGCYFGIPDVDPWDAERDARLYAGPWPVVAHPPCERWGRYATTWGGTVGDDAGCFAAALEAVRRWGGVLEHPAGSRAWPAFGLAPPPASGGWVSAGDLRGYVCSVEQGHYGHRARKATWLYAVAATLPALRWGASEAKILPRPGRDPERERRIGAVQRMCRRERAATPIHFRDLLLDIARSAKPMIIAPKARETCSTGHEAKTAGDRQGRVAQRGAEDNR